MSLFRCRSAWSTSLDDGDDQCGHNCLLVSSELIKDNNTVRQFKRLSFLLKYSVLQEFIVIGSYSGILRIFRPTVGPNNAAQPSDLILEKQLSYPILEVIGGVMRRYC